MILDCMNLRSLHEILQVFQRARYTGHVPCRDFSGGSVQCKFTRGIVLNVRPPTYGYHDVRKAVYYIPPEKRKSRPAVYTSILGSRISVCGKHEVPLRCTKIFMVIGSSVLAHGSSKPSGLSSIAIITQFLR